MRQLSLLCRKFIWYLYRLKGLNKQVFFVVFSLLLLHLLGTLNERIIRLLGIFSLKILFLFPAFVPKHEYLMFEFYFLLQVKFCLNSWFFGVSTYENCCCIFLSFLSVVCPCYRIISSYMVYCNDQSELALLCFSVEHIALWQNMKSWGKLPLFDELFLKLIFLTSAK